MKIEVSATLRIVQIETSHQLSKWFMSWKESRMKNEAKDNIHCGSQSSD
jgi:hypothetical protein